MEHHKELDYLTGQMNARPEESLATNQPIPFFPRMVFTPDGKMLITCIG
jgi:hypothetical protein